MFNQSNPGAPWDCACRFDPERVALADHPNSLAQVIAPGRARGAMLLRKRFADRACAQYVRAIPPGRGPGHRSRHFQTSRHTFIEASAQPSQPFGNPRRLDRPISQHDANPRLSLQREGSNGNAEIKGFCLTKYSLSFPLFSKISVKGSDKHPLYQYLTEQSPFPGEVEWTFQKYLVDRSGRVVGRFHHRTKPLSPEVVNEIERVLAAQ